MIIWSFRLWWFNTFTWFTFTDFNNLFTVTNDLYDTFAPNRLKDFFASLETDALLNEENENTIIIFSDILSVEELLDSIYNQDLDLNVKGLTSHDVYYNIMTKFDSLEILNDLVKDPDLYLICLNNLDDNLDYFLNIMVDDILQTSFLYDGFTNWPSSMDNCECTNPFVTLIEDRLINGKFRMINDIMDNLIIVHEKLINDRINYQFPMYNEMSIEDEFLNSNHERIANIDSINTYKTFLKKCFPDVNLINNRLGIKAEIPEHVENLRLLTTTNNLVLPTILLLNS